MFAQEFIVNRPIITLGYSTLFERCQDIELPEIDPRVEILIGIQGNTQSNIPEHLDRNDTLVTSLESIGVAKSRNHMIDHAKGDYLFFGDDDIDWVVNNIWEIVDYFESHSATHLITGKTVSEDGSYKKRYPNRSKKLNLFNCAKTGTVEMAIRVKEFRSSKVYFDENFGAGSDNYLGDEYIFITDALRQGIKCEYLPIDFTIHQGMSSGVIYGSKRDSQARSAVFSRVFKGKAFFVKLAFLLKNFTKFRKYSSIHTFLRTVRKE